MAVVSVGSFFGSVIAVKGQSPCSLSELEILVMLKRSNVTPHQEALYLGMWLHSATFLGFSNS